MSATSIVNDGNNSGTQIVESTVLGDTTSAVKLTNTGNFTLGNASHPGSLSLDNAKVTTDGSGNATFGSLTVSNAATLSNNVQLTYGTGNKIGSNQIAAFSNGIFTSAGAPETINHLFRTTPKAVFVWKNSGTTNATHKEITNITSTQFTIASGTTAGQVYGFLAIG
jgi:hypothetical protein